MPTFSQLPSGKWRAQVRRAGVYRAATFTTKREAKDWAAAVESQVHHIAAGGFAPVPKGATLADLIDKYTEQPGYRAGKTKEATLAMIRRNLGPVRLASLNAVVLRDFIDRRQEAGAGGVTIAADLSYLSSILKWGRHARNFDLPDRLALDARASLKHRGLNTRGEEREREPTNDELWRLYAYWDNNPRLMLPMSTLCRFALATGMRQGEITRLMIEDINRSARTVVIRDRKDPKNKIGNHQTVPLLADAWAIVQPLIDGKKDGLLFPYREASISTAFTRACKAVEPPIIDLHFHDLRHKATADFFRMGLDIPRVALMTGHKTWSMLRRYTAIKPEDVHAALKVQAVPKRNRLKSKDVHAALKKPASPAPDHAGQQGGDREA